MGQEYFVKWVMPKDYSADNVLRKLPSPISKDGHEIYNYSVNKDEFYFLDHLVDRPIAARALQVFIDEALKHSDKIQISEA